MQLLLFNSQIREEISTLERILNSSVVRHPENFPAWIKVCMDRIYDLVPQDVYIGYTTKENGYRVVELKTNKKLLEELL